MMRLLDLPDSNHKTRGFYIAEDWLWYVTAHMHTTVASDSGTVAVGDAAGGVLVLTPSDGSVADNDEAYVRTTNELFLFAADKPFYAEQLMKFTEANTDDANVAFGFMNAVAANSILDNGGGPAASFSGAVIYKIDGGTVWRCRSSVGTSNNDSISTTTAGGSSYQWLRIECRPVSSTICEISYFVDNVPLLDSTTNRPIKHSLTYTGATEMHLFTGVKNGDTNLETVNIDKTYAGGLNA
jgi:hypothetical protein